MVVGVRCTGARRDCVSMSMLLLAGYEYEDYYDYTTPHQTGASITSSVRGHDLSMPCKTQDAAPLSNIPFWYILDRKCLVPRNENQKESSVPGRWWTGLVSHTAVVRRYVVILLLVPTRR